MANSIDRHYGLSGLRAVSVHPGLILTTQLGRHMPPEQLAKFATLEPFARSAEQGPATTVWAALSPHFNSQGGVYLVDAGMASVAAETEPLCCREAFQSLSVRGPGYLLSSLVLPIILVFDSDNQSSACGSRKI
jgi:hypothetical protein